jgi:hypothetical protein
VLLELELADSARCADLLPWGVPAETLAQAHLSAVGRARDDTPADGVDQVAAVGERVLATLESLA